MTNSPKISTTNIPGLLLVELPLHRDNRGWFKENWQREKMVAAGLPDFRPVQNNISFNDARGTTRGVHAEPWDKFISIASGRIFGAWVDLREGESFGAVFTRQLGPECAVYVPHGVGNAYQTLDTETSYSYLVDDHWRPDAKYTFLNLADETSAIKWPIPLQQAEISSKDLTHPRLYEIEPMKPRKTLVIGAGGQLGAALRTEFENADYLTRADFDLDDDAAYERQRWSEYDLIINAAAYTNVDGAETAEGRAQSWASNVTGVSKLARIATAHNLTLVNISSDYVFDGSQAIHDESEPPSPLGVYGQTKAAGDSIVETVPRHYTIRTSWVIGDGRNFVRTMADLAARGVAPAVVNDQIGRLTFATDLAAGIAHLVKSRSPYGIYNLSNEGPAVSWQQIAARVFELCGSDPGLVAGVTTEQYFRGKNAAPRPLNSALSLRKITETGFRPREGDIALVQYLNERS